MEPRSAYARAESFLDFTSGYKWAARFAGLLTAFATIGLFVVLGLFIDLMIHRGRIPSFVQLNAHVRERYNQEMRALSPERRGEIIEAFGLSESMKGQFDSSWLPDPPKGTLEARELLWRSYLHDFFRKRISESAAQKFREAPLDGDPPLMGLLGLLVRQPGTQKVFSWFASWNPWTWWADQSGQNTWYLIGLAVIAMILAVIRAASYHWMHHAAAVTTLDAATRLRRAVYHHSNRLGTLALREGADSEIVSLFVKHIQNVHDALYSGLTTMFSEPIQLALLVLFALALDFWVALACILIAAVVILLGGYLAARFRDRARVEARRAAAQLSLLQRAFP